MRLFNIICAIFLLASSCSIVNAQFASKDVGKKPAAFMASEEEQIAFVRPDGSISVLDIITNRVTEYSPKLPGKPLGVAVSGKRICWLVASDNPDPTKTRAVNTLHWIDPKEETPHTVDLSDIGNLTRDKLVMADKEHAILIRGTAGVEITLLDGSSKFADTALVEKLIADQPDVRLIPEEVRAILPGMLRQLSRYGDNLWGVYGNAVIQIDTKTSKANAFLGWNVDRMNILNISANGSGLWVLTEQGLRNITPDSNPASNNGYNGFIKACLGGERDVPYNAPRQKLQTEMTSWLGTPYKYGGENRSGIDCSGFVMQAYRAVGFNLDHGSDYLRTCKQGVVVHDELRYGDILVFPGHCAIYAGNGRTFETVDASVGRVSTARASVASKTDRQVSSSATSSEYRWRAEPSII